MIRSENRYISCVKRSMRSRTRVIQDAIDNGDSFVLLGSGFDAKGNPTTTSRQRIDAVLALKRLKPDMATVITGGCRGVHPYTSRSSLKVSRYLINEATMFSAYLTHHGDDRSTHYLKTFACETAINIIEAFVEIVRLKLTRPVFISHDYHLAEHIDNIMHFVGRSSISPLFYPVFASPDVEIKEASVGRQAHIDFKKDGVPQLRSGGLTGNASVFRRSILTIYDKCIDRDTGRPFYSKFGYSREDLLQIVPSSKPRARRSVH